ncbi:MAG: hypothetical protein RBQ64_03755 [Candidatus Izemoplasmatales bacterium]|jgi:hypothetical protein|nr:hypothetical protein [Candidatus Izemoplasmatales bacterium]
MKSYVRLDDASKVVIENFKLIEQKHNHREYDGYRETNRRYSYYFVVKVMGEDDEIWNNPFGAFDMINVKRLLVTNELQEECCLFKIHSINKYQIDQAIDSLSMLVEGPGHYKIIKQNNKTFSLEHTTIFDFLGFFKWNQDLMTE